MREMTDEEAERQARINSALELVGFPADDERARLQADAYERSRPGSHPYWIADHLRAAFALKPLPRA